MTCPQPLHVLRFYNYMHSVSDLYRCIIIFIIYGIWLIVIWPEYFSVGMQLKVCFKIPFTEGEGILDSINHQIIIFGHWLISCLHLTMLQIITILLQHSFLTQLTWLYLHNIQNDRIESGRGCEQVIQVYSEQLRRQ